MTTAEKYRQLEKSPVINIARFIFNDLKNVAINTTLEKVIAEIKTGKTPSKQEKRFYEDDFFDWFKPDEIGSEKYLYNAKDKVSKYAFETKQATIFDPDTILINAIGDVGRISVLKKQASSNQQITGIRLKDEVLVDYAYFYLLAHREYFYFDLFQTTLPIVNQKKINSIPFCYPTLEEQKRIVKGLEEIENIKSIDDLRIIDNLNWKEDYKEICRNFFNLQFGTKQIVNELTYQLNLIKQLRQAFLREAMQGKLCHPELVEGQQTGHDLLVNIKAEKAQLIAEKKLKKEKPLQSISEEEIPFEIPEHWAWCRLGEICTKVTDGFHHSPKKLNEGKIYISATHIKDDGIKWDECLYIGEKDHNELFKKAFPTKGEILITNRGAGCGTPAIIDIDEEFSFQNTALIGFNQSMLNNKYVYNFILKSRDEIMAKFVNGGLQPMLSNVILRTIPFPLPPLHEQEQIVAKLEGLMAFCDGLEQSIKESQGYNEQLLQQVLREALQGKVIANED